MLDGADTRNESHVSLPAPAGRGHLLLRLDASTKEHKRGNHEQDH